MLEDALTGFKTQVQTIKARVSLLELVHHAQALQVVLKAAVRCHAFIECVLTGMSEGRVTQVMRQRHGLDQIFVQAQRAGDRAAELRHLQRVRQPGAEQVAFMVQKNLGFVNQPAKSR